MKKKKDLSIFKTCRLVKCNVFNLTKPVAHLATGFQNDAFTDFLEDILCFQVYKAKLRENGVPVAIKVQRPGVLEGISRDLFLLRIGASIFQKVPIVQSDMTGLLDSWAFRFFDELDYVNEVGDACDVTLTLILNF